MRDSLSRISPTRAATRPRPRFIAPANHSDPTRPRGIFWVRLRRREQEQYWSAYGLAKAFWELDLDIPAVIRLGANTEDRAVDILRRMSGLLRAPVEGYRKTDAPAMIAGRFAEIVAGAGGNKWKPRPSRVPTFAKDPSATNLPVKSGRVWIARENRPRHCRVKNSPTKTPSCSRAMLNATRRGRRLLS